MHENHRERVRQRFFAEGIDNMPEHNVLEMLLFYCFTRKDTNPLAHRLISAFGSLAGVLDAPAEKLMEVEGVGESTAAFLTMIPQVCRRYLAEKQNTDKLSLDEPEQLKEYAASLFAGSTVEEFRMLCFDGAGSLTGCVSTEAGSLNKIIFNKREILDAAFRYRAVSVIFVHNHPSGVASPSREDISATIELGSLFSAVDIKVVDHYVIGSTGELLSIAATTRYASLFK